MSTSQLKMESLSDAGQPPESRLSSSGEVKELVEQMVRADNARSKVRARVQGLVDGNSPYNAAELRRTGQSYRTNVNFREAEGFLSLALGAFYDVFSETPSYAAVRLNYGDANESEQYSRIVTEEFDRLQKLDDDFDYLIQLSQHEMVMFGSGPVLFEDTTNWRCKAIKASDLLLPEGSKSNINEWQIAVVRSTYNAHELYSYIRNPEAATSMGWNLKATRKSIMDGAPEDMNGRREDWEYYQTQLRNNDLTYSSKCDVIQAAHVFYREFPDDNHPEGAISHCIIDERGDGKEFMFRKVRRYDNWRQAIHCLYYDKGTGTHHSVKGMGQKMYSAMELKNRLRCATIDSAFARSQIMLQPTTPDALNRSNVIQQGPWATLASGWDVVQTNSPGVLDATMAVEKDLEGLLQANMSQYRQRLEKPGGNPRTATEIQAISAQQSSLGKTQLNRYYEQLDALFAERYRRAVSSKLTKDVPGGREALEFVKRCTDRGVPKQALQKVDWVKATRTAGQGSGYQRQAVMSDMLSIVTMLPESGREAVLQDYIASKVGQQMVDRYKPAAQSDASKQEQEQETAIENPLFTLGASVPVSEMDNHVIHAQGHLQFGVQAAESVQEGGDPTEVAATLQALLPHIALHLKALEIDPTRKDIVGILTQQAEQLADIAEQLIGELQKQQEQQAAQMEEQQAAQMELEAMQNGADSKDQIAQARFEREEARRDAKLQADIGRKQEKARVDIAVKDAKSAASIAKK